MSRPTYFVQECPTCGRPVRVRVEHLGRAVVCEHCQGKFQALDPVNHHHNAREHADELLRRADDLLESIARREARLRTPNPK